jgi:Bacterial HORMA domain family 1
MSSSYSVSESESFTITHAKHMAAKVATDLKRVQRLYETPSDAWIQAFEQELIAYLKAGYLREVTYGFRRDDTWVEPTLRYTAKDLAGSTASDDDPGQIRPGASTDGCSFYSYLIQNDVWDTLTPDEQAAFKKDLPFQRTGALEPTVSGYLSQDKSYSAGGKALNRSIVTNTL